MKKWLSILGVCGIVSMSAILTACDKPNNNENGENNKPEPKPEKPQEPPVGSKWKLIDKKDYSNEIKNINNKWYIGIFPKMWSSGKPISPYSILKQLIMERIFLFMVNLVTGLKLQMIMFIVEMEMVNQLNYQILIKILAKSPIEKNKRTNKSFFKLIEQIS